MRQCSPCSWVLSLLPLAAQAPIAPLVGTVLAPDGTPVNGAAIVVSRCDGRLFRCLDLALNREWVEVARARTDNKGRFGMQLPVGLALRVEVDHAPFARWRDESVVPGDSLTVRLEPACSWKGQLVERTTGKGTPGLLTAWNPHTRVELCRGRTDAEGRFAFDRLPSGPVTFDVEPDAASEPIWLDLELARGEQLERTIELASGITLSGSVTDAATGEPIAGALVGEGWTLGKHTRTDAAGRYSLRGFAGTATPDVHCVAAGYARGSLRQYPNGDDRTRMDFVLARGAPVVGRVADADGKPVANAYVAAIGVVENTIPWQPARTNANGEFVCDGFPRGLGGVLMVRCAGYASLVYFLPRPAGDGQIDFGTVTLRAPRLVRGTVVDADGKPAAGIRVGLRGVNADAAWLAVAPPTWGFLSLYAGERQARTDANGAFAFGDVAPGAYELCFVDMPASTTNDAQPLTVQATADPAPLRLQLSR